MNEKQFLKKFSALKKKLNQSIDKEVVLVVAGGRVDLDSFDNDFILPRIVMAAIMKALYAYMMPIKKYKKDVNKLAGFINKED